ncbi:hypothetical protein PSH58_11585 [Pseudomonas hefeiensis]|uniref:Uncharacterized protein n=1 Tax=Pseudomonas hefeiensis TaxID=2738125 RepID=A0ABY9GHA9_9PSED|nr:MULTISPECIES: hypothetical protein [unclassified Pseudomonas]WLH14881.1 hypothetical protein PSH57_11560 [Pseudomonas sp. FP205]WLH97930.1 hypothetical protein PSH58_11585 [Pseudomonas sp. FP53]WLI42206.1 hypothetical protein PSH74_11535 [Pseudomonas sp. FP821]
MTTVTPSSGATPSSQNNSASAFDAKLDIAKSSRILADYMKEKGKGAISGNELSSLANASSKEVPAEVSAAAEYMTRHSDVFTAIETHDVAGADNYSGAWNFEWAADGGLKGTATEALANMSDVFDSAIAKSAQITELTTVAKTELDSSKQRPQN